MRTRQAARERSPCHGGRGRLSWRCVHAHAGAEGTVNMSSQIATELRVGADGSLRIPANLANRAVLSPGDKVTVSVAQGCLSVAAAAQPSAVIDRFVRDSDQLLPDVGEDYRMSDGLTVREYLALDEGDRDALWQQAMEEAQDAADADPETAVPADVLPAGQEHRARGL